MSGTVLGIEDTGMSKIVFALKDKLWEWLTPSAYVMPFLLREGGF